MDKDKRDAAASTLTTERIKQKFKSQFELVGYAIRLAENMIRSGREPRVRTDIQNKAIQVIAEIACGKDQFDEIIVEQRPPMNFHQRDFHENYKGTEKRKPRKIFND